jgi:hypothetical protein
MLLWILIVWTVFSVSCALAAGRFIALADRRWLSKVIRPGHSCPSDQDAIPYTISGGPKGIAAGASLR